MENIDEVALCVKGKASTTYEVLGLGYGGRACQGANTIAERRERPAHLALRNPPANAWHWRAGIAGRWRADLLKGL